MLVSRHEAKYLKAIEQLIRRPIPWFNLEGNDDAAFEEVAGEDSARSRGRRRGSPKKASEPAIEEKHAPQHVSRNRQGHEPARHGKASHPAKRSPSGKPPRGEPAKLLPDAPDSKGFHKDNMPAFLMRKTRPAETV
jgi:hypothetical protein